MISSRLPRNSVCGPALGFPKTFCVVVRSVRTSGLACAGVGFAVGFRSGLSGEKRLKEHFDAMVLRMFAFLQKLTEDWCVLGSDSNARVFASIRSL